MSDRNYALTAGEGAEIAAPDLPYRPPVPERYRPKIALIGAGGISGAHLDAYRTAGFDVAVICSRTLASATARRNEFFPDAEATDSVARVLDDPSIEVVDITLHPGARGPLIEAALEARKHVLSQKPFVSDLREGARLCDLADRQGVRLAVNMNGRWAPHLAWMRQAVAEGLIGDVLSVDIAIHWDHGWIAGTPFDAVPDLILSDFGIHWFDFVTTVVDPACLSRVQAMMTRVAGQTAKPPLLGHAAAAFDGGQAALTFNGAVRHGARDATVIAGTAGLLVSTGPDLGHQSVILTTSKGTARPVLEGKWFNDGFRGTMGELLCAIEEGRAPSHEARGVLAGHALTQAAIRAAETGDTEPLNLAAPSPPRS